MLNEENIATEIETMTLKRVHIGSINAHITGDMRYWDKLTVTLSTNSPWGHNSDCSYTIWPLWWGGMDSYTGDAKFARDTVEFGRNISAFELVKAIKTVINRSEYLFKRYGTPSKNFSWCTGARGLNVKNAAAALRWLLDTQ